MTASKISPLIITPPRRTLRQNMRFVRRNFSGIVGLTIVVLVVLCAIFADQIALYPPVSGDLMESRLPPAWMERGTWSHPLGTDQLGQDIFSRSVYGSLVSVTVGFFGAFLAMIIGLTAGLLAGYERGIIDTVFSSLVNVLLSIPYVVLVIVVATIFGRSLINVILIFGVTNSPIFFRVARGETMRLKNEEYVQAAFSLGATRTRIIFYHLIPNMLGMIITLATFEMSAMIIYESGLSFLGLSVPPSVPSWGNMLSLGRQFLTIFPWMAVYPGLAIVITSMGINFLGERVRELLDPRMNNMGL